MENNRREIREELKEYLANMTREQAENEIREAFTQPWADGIIKALKQEPKTVPTIEAIPKDQYEAQLKADMVTMLTEIQLEIEETVKEEELIDKNWANGLHYSEKIIQQKIDKLKEVEQ